jgi:hypothetical protein
LPIAGLGTAWGTEHETEEGIHKTTTLRNYDIIYGICRYCGFECENLVDSVGFRWNDSSGGGLLKLRAQLRGYGSYSEAWFPP